MKISHYPNQPHCFAFGGFDMQMLNVINSVNSIGVNAVKMDVWSRERDFDILHVWNVTPYNYHVINWAKKSNIKVVATVLFPYSSYLLWLKYYKNIFTKQMKMAKHIHNLIDKYVVLNERQLEMLNRYYGICKSKIEIIPNIINEEFFNSRYDKNTSINLPLFDYVLCTGNISNRKNQLNLAKAAIELNINLVIIGNVLDGEESYASELKFLVENNKNILWKREIEEGSTELVNYYKNCKVFALPSYEETQPISVLEAVCLDKPILMQNKEYAKQKYYNGAYLCENGSVKSIKKELVKIYNSSIQVDINEFIDECKQDSVAEKYKILYESLISEK